MLGCTKRHSEESASSKLLPALAANLALAHDHLVLTTTSSKYGHFWPQKSKMETAKIQTGGFKTAEHKPLGDVTDVCLRINQKSTYLLSPLMHDLVYSVSLLKALTFVF